MQKPNSQTTPQYDLMTEGDLYKHIGFDGRKWAEAFCHIFAGRTIPDEGTMTTWFCAALMRGFDESGWQEEAKAKKALEELKCQTNQ